MGMGLGAGAKFGACAYAHGRFYVPVGVPFGNEGGEGKSVQASTHTYMQSHCLHICMHLHAHGSNNLPNEA